jgi:hypothetical protein
MQDVSAQLLDAISAAFELVWLSSISALESMDDRRVEDGDNSHARIWKVPKAYLALARSVPSPNRCHAWLGHFDQALQRSSSEDSAAERTIVVEVLDAYLAKAKASWGNILDKTLAEYPNVKAYVTEAYPEMRIPVYHLVPSVPSTPTEA